MKKITMGWIFLTTTFVIGIAPIIIMWSVMLFGNSEQQHAINSWFDRLDIPYTIVNILFFLTLAAMSYLYKDSKKNVASK